MAEAEPEEEHMKKRLKTPELLQEKDKVLLQAAKRECRLDDEEKRSAEAAQKRAARQPSEVRK